MNLLELDTATGQLYLSKTLIAPLGLDVLRNAAKRARLEQSVENEYVKFGADVMFCGTSFGLNVTYHNTELYSLWLAWDGASSTRKGYEVSMNDLIADKRTLSKMLSKCFALTPQQRDEAHDTFSFIWGKVSVAAIPKSSIVTIGIRWNS